MLEAVNLFRAQVVDVATDSLVVEVTGDPGKIQAILRVLEPYGIKELAVLACSAWAADRRASPTGCAEHPPETTRTKETHPRE